MLMNADKKDKKKNFIRKIMKNNKKNKKYLTHK